MDFDFGSFGGKRLGVGGTSAFDRRDPLNRGSSSTKKVQAAEKADSGSRNDSVSTMLNDSSASPQGASRTDAGQDLGKDKDVAATGTHSRKRTRRAGPRYRRFAEGPSIPVSEVPLLKPAGQAAAGVPVPRARFDVDFLREAAKNLSLEEARTVNQIVSKKSSRLLATLRTVRFEPNETPVALGNSQQGRGAFTDEAADSRVRSHHSVTPEIVPTSVRSGVPAPTAGRYRSATSGLTVTIEKGVLMPIVDGQPTVWRFLGQADVSAGGTTKHQEPALKVGTSSDQESGKLKKASR